MSTTLGFLEDWKRDWKKMAATGMPGQGSSSSSPEPPTQDTSQTPNADVEKAFLDQAYMLIQNKGTPLMKSPYRVGFEIVFKNDENTRLVGIFIFRVDRHLFYAPCFFLSGTIKGTDLLYRHSEKQFVPLNSEWAEYLISQTDETMGSGIPMSERAFTRHQVELRDLAMPPQFQNQWRKFSSTGPSDPGLREFWNENKAMILSAMPGLNNNQSLLRKFLVEDGGMNARYKLAAAIKSRPDFGQALMDYSKPENFAPEVNLPEPIWEPLLVFHSQPLRDPHMKSASAQDMIQGWQLEDFRKEAEINGLVYAAGDIYLEQITEPGVYDMLMPGGDTDPCLVGYEMPWDYIRSGCGHGANPIWEGDTCREISSKRVVISLKDKASCCVSANPVTTYWYQTALGKKTDDLRKCEELKDKPTQGKAWRMVSISKGEISDPFYAKEIKTSGGGLTEVVICRYDKDSPERLPLTLHPEENVADMQEKVYGPDYKFIEVKLDSSEGGCLNFDNVLQLGSRAALNQIVFNNSYKRASVHALPGGEWLLEELAGVDATPRRSPPLSDTQLMVNLVTHCNVREATAREIVKSASEKKVFAFYFRPFTKEGHNLSFNEWPIMEPVGNSEFNTLEEPRHLALIQAKRDQPYIHPHRVGDLYRGGGRNGPSKDGFSDGSIMNMETPMGLAQMSQNRGQSALFEHGVVGELVKTYDATAMVDKYLPDLLAGLDRLGRLLFLLYWKPDDFAQDYGADDQVELENQMLSSFKQLGQLVLDLIQKSDALKTPDTFAGRMT